MRVYLGPDSPTSVVLVPAQHPTRCYVVLEVWPRRWQPGVWDVDEGHEMSIGGADHAE